MAKFIVDYTFHGRGTDTIEADTLAEAEERIENEVDRDDFEPPVDDFDDINFRVREMHAVTRNGHEIWSTYVMASDTRGHASASAPSLPAGEES